jgi:formamidopyrimidine-DNA glycosylase
LFAHRWEDGGKCPRCHTDLMRDVVGGRRTCWCPKCQPAKAGIAGRGPRERRPSYD